MIHLDHQLPYVGLSFGEGVVTRERGSSEEGQSCLLALRNGTARDHSPVHDIRWYSRRRQMPRGIFSQCPLVLFCVLEVYGCGVRCMQNKPCW
ncbi:hypothetical protein AVEN_103805-1 [Araneus ventricosus]|uniref:Uncharacterized protein n=1 Tax=Araneus ventricosus TaxID=182803 RepID=A0A4Y2G5S2_ARAVE|nr:hypothetical protein AVEN_103805-1 [Araneus ventricosus]